MRLFTFFILFFFALEASIKAIIFDCDGVLVDSEGLKYLAWQKTLQTRNIDFSRDEYKTFAGHTGRHILTQILSKRGLPFDPSISEEKNEEYWRLQKECIQGMDPMLSLVPWAKDQKLLLGVASSAAKHEILVNLHKLQIEDYFSEVLSGKDDLLHIHDPEGVNKPKPYIYQETCKRLSVEPKDCLVFEDSEAGVEAAKTAGCYVIAVPTEWTQDQNFKKADQVFLPMVPETLKRVILSMIQSE